MRRVPFPISLAVLLAFLAVPDLSAQAPQPEQITFQGRLTDAEGNPVTGDVSMTFSIYDAASGGVALWTETQSVVVTAGLYSAQLGTVSDFSGFTLDMTSGRWLGIQVAGEASEMSPRYPLTGVPYARRALGADDAGTLDGLDSTAFARTSHFHNASAITSGILTIARGGTGLDDTGAAGNILVSDSKYWVSTPGASTFIQNQTASAQGGSFWISGTAVIDLALSARGTVALGDALTDNVTIGGTLQGAMPLVFEGGVADTNELTLTIATLTGDRTISLPDADGTVITTGNLAGITQTGTITSGTWQGAPVDVEYGGTGNTAAGFAGSVAYSTGTAFSFTASGTSGHVLKSGGTGAPTWGTVVLDETTGTLAAARGGTGLTSSGSSGNYLRSNGSGWASSAIQAADLPALGAYYVQNQSAVAQAASFRIDGQGTMAGLTANGNVVLGDAAVDMITIAGTIQGASPLVFEGATINDYETTFAITNPTADRTITFPNVSGTVITTGNAADLASEFLAKDAPDTSTASSPGFFYDLANTSGSAGSGVLQARMTAVESPGGNYYAIRATCSLGDNAGTPSTNVNNAGIDASASGSSKALGAATYNYGVYGAADGSSYDSITGLTANYGVFGLAAGTETTRNYGVYGHVIGLDATVNYAVYGNASSAQGASNYAGYFNGNVHVSGTLSKAAGSFTIDHPLDPADWTLSHSFVESADMKNIYDGVAVLDAKGEAVVTMPDWFEALNRDFRYQLTPVGGPAPDLHIAEKVTDGQFKIAGGWPGLEVSWQVTGIRQDAFARRHPIVVEERKSKHDRGRYLSPEAFGLPPEMGIGYVLPPKAAKATAQAGASKGP